MVKTYPSSDVNLKIRNFSISLYIAHLLRNINTVSLKTTINPS